MTPEQCRAAILEAEQTAADGIARDLAGLAGVHGEVVAFIESRWTDWLDRRVDAIEREFYAQEEP